MARERPRPIWLQWLDMEVRALARRVCSPLHHPRRILVPLLAGTVVAGCAAPAPRVTLDLGGLLAEAELRRETSLIDLGTVEARGQLGDGWSVDETRRDGTTMVWAVGRRAELSFFLAQPGAFTLELRCSPFQPPGAAGQRVELWLNDRRVGAAEMTPGLRGYSIPIVATDTVAGHNRLDMRFDVARRPSAFGEGGDERELAARFDLIRLVGVGDPGAPSVRAGSGDLVVPAGIELAFFLTPTGEAMVELDGLDGSGDARLELRWLVDGGPERLLASLEPGAGRRSIAMPEGKGQPVRLGVRAVGDVGGVVLTHPRVSWVLASPEGPRPSLAARGEGPSDRPPNLLVYLVDTLRADRLGCYGHPAGLSPHVDALADDGVLFEQVMAQCSWTTPSVASILTGLRPSRHGVNSRLSVLPAEAVTAAELLREAGYQTAGFSTNAYIAGRAGFDQGFDHFEFAYRRSHEVTAAVAAWLEERDRDRPFFLYLHTVDPHAPYEPELAFRQRFAPEVGDPRIGTTEHLRALSDGTVPATDAVTAALQRLYDAEVAENDDAFGELVGVLRQSGLWEDTVVIFVADHGEEFREHGVIGHGWDLYGEALDVPLVVRAPGGLRGHRVGELVQHTDVLPTLLEAAGVPAPAGLDGASLWGAVCGMGPGPDGCRAALAFMDYEGRRGMAVRQEQWKLIEPLSRNFSSGRELYDLAADPGELHNVTERLPVRSGVLAALAKREMGRRTGDLPAVEGPELGGDTRHGLEALGYLR
jgi:arylsulfatase A-like enzyme